jgi:hypothetical protein
MMCLMLAILAAFLVLTAILFRKTGNIETELLRNDYVETHLLKGVALIGAYALVLVLLSQSVITQTFDKINRYGAINKKLMWNLTEAHLWFEESMSGDGSVDLKKDFYQPLEKIQILIDSLIKGGGNEYGRFEPIESSEFKTHLQSFQKKLEDFVEIGRIRVGGTLQERVPGSEADQKFDRVFAEIKDIADLISRDISLANKKNEAKLVWVNRGVTFTIFIAFVLLVYLVRKGERV